MSHRPILGGEPSRSFTIAGRPEPEPADTPWAATITVTPGVFSVLRIPLLEGRLFSTGDSETSPRVAVISRAAAERYWPENDPVGARIRMGDIESDSSWIEIVGVVGDIRNPDADQPPEPHIYLPQAQFPVRSMALVMRTRIEPSSIFHDARRVVWEVDPNQPVFDPRTMEQILYDDFASGYALIGLLSYFALVALGLAIAGVYGVTSYYASLRSHEIGIRMALGARARDVLKMVLRQGLLPVGLGAVLGILGAIGLARALTHQVYGISATDPSTYIGAAVVLGAIALLAALLPAIRASRKDPTDTLRHE
jgi:predicted permease